MAHDGRPGVSLVGICGLLLASGWLLPEPAAAGRHTAAECRAACESRNIPASCEWLTRVPQRCIRDAERACQRNPVPGAAQCLPPKDLPACGTNNSCPYGSLCVDATCQVVGCGSHDGVADCTGNNACKYDKCVVADCSGATANCPKGFHCAVENSEFGDVSGTCVADEPDASYCMADTDCIAPGGFNPKCLQGVCTRQGRPLGRCQTSADCPRWCRRGLHTMRPFGCDVAGMCVCPDCIDGAECAGLLACRSGLVATCLARPSGTCVCRKALRSTTTTTTITSTTETTATVPPSTTSTTLNTVCCCNFEVGDSQWHCIHSPMPSPWLCAIPWPACCSEAYTVCQ